MTRQSYDNRVLKRAGDELSSSAACLVGVGCRVKEKDALNNRSLVVHAGNVLSGINAAPGKAGGNHHNVNPDAQTSRFFPDRILPVISRSKKL